MKRLDHVEAIHLRHHQIEHDQIGPLPPRGRDRFASAVCAQDGAGQAHDADGDQFDRLGIVVDDQDLERMPLRHRKKAQVDERLVQLLPGDRLLHHGRRAEREAFHAIRHDRNDYDRDALQLRHLLDAVENFTRPCWAQMSTVMAPAAAARENERGFGGDGVQHREALRLELHADQVG